MNASRLINLANGQPHRRSIKLIIFSLNSSQHFQTTAAMKAKIKKLTAFLESLTPHIRLICGIPYTSTVHFPKVSRLTYIQHLLRALLSGISLSKKHSLAMCSSAVGLFEYSSPSELPHIFAFFDSYIRPSVALHTDIIDWVLSPTAHNFVGYTSFRSTPGWSELFARVADTTEVHLQISSASSTCICFYYIYH